MLTEPIASTDAGVRRARLLSWAAVATLAAGLALRNCVLIAASALVALQAFRAHMDANSPWQGWRAALRCALAGLVGLFGAGALLAMVGGAWMGWWEPRSDQPMLGLLVLALAAFAGWTLHPRDEGERYRVANAFAMLAGGIALLFASLGWSASPCVFAFVTAMAVGWMGWTLLRSVAGELLMADGRR